MAQKTQLCTVLLLVICCQQFTSCWCQPNDSAQGQMCSSILGKLAAHHKLRELRNLVQLWVMHYRIFVENDHIVHENKRTPEEVNSWPAQDRERWEAMWKADNETIAQAQAQAEIYGKLQQEHQQNLDQMIKQLKEEGIIQSNVTYEWLAPCVAHRLDPSLYKDTPVVSFMLQYFRHPKTVKPITDNLLKCNAIVPCELLVNVDSPEEASLWAQAVEQTQGFVVPVLSANIHEMRGYNRLARMAAGQFLIMLQDDFVLTDNCTWLTDFLKLYERWPELAIIGMKGYTWGWPGANHGDPMFKDKVTGFPFQFVTKVDWAPMAVRRSAFLQIGGIDEGLADRGHCGILTDWDLCLRMWFAGWKVGFHRVDHHNIDYGATHVGATAHRCWGRQQGMAGAGMSRRGNGQLERLAAIQAFNDNFDLLQSIDPSKTAELQKYRNPPL